MSESLRPASRPRPLTEVAALLGVADPITGAGVAVSGVTLDSSAVRAGDLFIGRRGANNHGASHARAAVQAGAVALLTDTAGALLADLPPTVPVLVVNEVAAVVGPVAAFVYGEPAASLTTIGVTGTNGKTTTTWLIESALRAHGVGVGLIGTLGVHLAGPGESQRTELPSARTTPEAPDLHALLAVMLERNVSDVAMEVSSHALALGRVNGLVFDLGIFTNLTQDHLDFHPDLESYFGAKASLFTAERARRGLVFVGDAWGRRLAEQAAIPVVTYDDEGPADWTASDVRMGEDGTTTFRVHGPGDVDVPLNLQLPGRFQVANALAAVAALAELGLDPGVSATGVSDCRGVPGRMERVADGQDFLALVDYAHTPEAVARSLATAREIVPGRLLVALGCGGDRDRAKRPLMGAAAAAADVVVVTDDNPRSEDAAAIRAAVLAGARAAAQSSGAAVHEIADRAAAISALVGWARPGDAVVILGKGAESGQEIGTQVLPFDDRVQVLEALRGLGAAT